jgi:predicted DNA-binding transcriptional regulator AlpA
MNEGESKSEEPPCELEPLPQILLDVDDVAAVLKVSVRQIRRFHRAGIIGPEPAKLGRLLRWSRIELEAWAAAGCPQRADWLKRSAAPRLRAV